MLIGDVARLSHVTAATIRYYEHLGLLTAPLRSSSGYRRYNTMTLDELRFIKKGQALGFSLEELGEILNLTRSGQTPCSRVLELAQRNVAIATARIQQLQALRDRLTAEIAKWKGKEMPNCAATGLCAIINSAELPDSAARPTPHTISSKHP